MNHIIIRTRKFKRITNTYKMANKEWQKWQNGLDRRLRDTYNRDTKDKQNVRKWKTKKVDIIFGKSWRGGNKKNGRERKRNKRSNRNIRRHK